MTGFAFAYAVMRVCGGQPRKNPGAPRLYFLFKKKKKKKIKNFEEKYQRKNIKKLKK